MLIERYRNGALTPHNDPLIGVCMVDRERAIDAVMREEEHLFQIEVYVQLTSPIEGKFRKEFTGGVIDELSLAAMNHRIYEHVRKWVEDRILRGWYGLTVEDFLYEVVIEQTEFSPVYTPKYPEVYSQLEAGTAPYQFQSLDKYTLHAMAKQWLSKNTNNPIPN